MKFKVGDLIRNTTGDIFEIISIHSTIISEGHYGSEIFYYDMQNIGNKIHNYVLPYESDMIDNLYEIDLQSTRDKKINSII